MGGVPAVANAELVSFRVGHHDPACAVLAARVGFEADCAVTLQPFDFFVDVWGVDVEVQAVLRGLRFGYSLE